MGSAGVHSDTHVQERYLAREKHRNNVFLCVKAGAEPWRISLQSCSEGKMRWQILLLVACSGRTAAVLYTRADETQLYARCRYVASTVYLTRAHPSASSPRKQTLATKVRCLCSMQRTE